MNSLPKSPLAPDRFPDIPSISGVELKTGRTGMKYKGRDDLLLMSLPEGTGAAGVFTKSKTASAPVLWCRSLVDPEAGAAAGGRLVVVNAGNANAFTGSFGVDEVTATVKAGAKVIGCAENQVFVASTGVIGETMPPDTIAQALTDRAALGGAEDWLAAAMAIMTTDTYPKGAFAETEIGGVPIKLAGVAKGSGMIAPDMATMLSFIVTDARIPSAVLQEMLSADVQTSFNAITVDSDTSTSDTVLLFSAGTAGDHADVASVSDTHLSAFRGALQSVMGDLAHQIVRDGEGATKFIEVQVRGAATADSARKIGMAIANSPLVKTAIAGEDANWGRVVMAVGKAGEPADRDKLAIWFGGHRVARNGVADPGFDEALIDAHLKGSKILLEVDVGVGQQTATVWTCDLTHGYISINADYRS